jgi:4-hydroxy-3-polyprenylbenzoate decarboxylase
VSAPFLELQSFLTHLDGAKRLQRVRQPVDKDTELACIVRRVIEGTHPEHACALLFENVRGHKVPVADNLFPTHDLYAAALGTTSDRLLEHPPMV